MTDAYREFLERKVKMAPAAGFPVDDADIHPMLKPHQRAGVKWAAEGGRRALFEAFGLGKSMQQLEILRLARKHAGGAVLIVVPLGVRQEFRIDGEKLGIATRFIRTDAEIDVEFDGILESPCATARRPPARRRGTQRLPVDQLASGR